MTTIPQFVQSFPAPGGRGMAQRRLNLRNSLWPDVPAHLIWNRKGAKGFTTIPRTLPLLGHAVDNLSSGKPLSGVYFDLWCRANDEGFVECKAPAEFAFSSGFTTQRGVHTWAERITELENLGFVKACSGAAGPRNFLLLINPYYAVVQLWKAGRIDDRLWNALNAQCSQIGANDIDVFSMPPPPLPPAPPMPPPARNLSS